MTLSTSWCKNVQEHDNETEPFVNNIWGSHDYDVSLVPNCNNRCWWLYWCALYMCHCAIVLVRVAHVWLCHCVIVLVRVVHVSHLHLGFSLAPCDNNILAIGTWLVITATSSGVNCSSFTLENNIMVAMNHDSVPFMCIMIHDHCYVSWFIPIVMHHD